MPSPPFGPCGAPPRRLDALATKRCEKGGLAEQGALHLSAIRVTRYKPGRRCMIEYDVAVAGNSAPQAVTWIGKVRRRRFGKSGHRLLSALWQNGFSADSPDGISVPEPVGHIPAFRMWLQRKMPGRPATELLAGPEGTVLASRIAEAAHKLHRTGVPAARSHTMADELGILRERLAEVALARPDWRRRIERLLQAAQRLGESQPAAARCGSHRDFYPDQVIVNGGRLYLIDFDLYCEGEPGLDIGNFIGHLTEQALRTRGDHRALAGVEQTLEDRFADLAGEETRSSVRAYATLTLIRQVYLSTLFPERRALTEDILELCEQRPGLWPRLALEGRHA